jgi:hypothetical protein
VEIEVANDMTKNNDSAFIMDPITSGEKRNMFPLFSFTHGLLVDIFGDSIMNSECCIVFNDPTAECPMLITNSSPIKMRTVTKRNYRSWAQIVYQLAHELTHYAIRQYKTDKNIFINWFEETVCEAVSLCVLRFASEKWDRCALQTENHEYSTSFMQYYNDKYTAIGEDKLSLCRSKDDLYTIEKDSQTPEGRLARSKQRNYLADTLFQMPHEIVTCARYTLFIRGIEIDFEKWKSSEYNSPLVPHLESIQPRIA